MMLTSMFALEFAPMTLVITFRALSPVFSLCVERLFPHPLEVSPAMLTSLVAMLVGVFVYVYGMEGCHWAGAGWAVLNSFFAVAERLLQRFMIAKDQQPVDISKTGMTLLNNLVGIVPVLIAAIFIGEHRRLPAILADLDAIGITWIALSCLASAGISYSGIWTQSLISATSSLVLVNTNKFVILILDAFIIRPKEMPANQIVGALMTILAGLAYAKARQEIEEPSSAIKHSSEDSRSATFDSALEVE
jgi:drug/metabolite transporter (DMT)-like permease